MLFSSSKTLLAIKTNLSACWFNLLDKLFVAKVYLTEKFYIFVRFFLIQQKYTCNLYTVYAAHLCTNCMSIYAERAQKHELLWSLLHYTMACPVCFSILELSSHVHSVTDRLINTVFSQSNWYTKQSSDQGQILISQAHPSPVTAAVGRWCEFKAAVSNLKLCVQCRHFKCNFVMPEQGCSSGWAPSKGSRYVRWGAEASIKTPSAVQGRCRGPHSRTLIALCRVSTV